MGVRQLEAQILAELKEATGNKTLRQKDIQEWSTGPIEAREGEKVVMLSGLGVRVAYKARADS